MGWDTRWQAAALGTYMRGDMMLLLLNHFCFLLTLVGQNKKRLLEGMAGTQSPLSEINAIISSQQSYLFVFSVSLFLPHLLPAHNFPNLELFSL